MAWRWQRCMTEAPLVRAVVVDDEPAAREVVLTLLEEHPSIEIVGEATNGSEAVDLLRLTRPDLVFWTCKCRTRMALACWKLWAKACHAVSCS
jgi:chemotaxis response regulator CheB